MNRKITILLNRDSVCAGDDYLAPHDKKIEYTEIRTLSELVSRIIEINYLPNIAGGKATWILTNNKEPLAIMGKKDGTVK